MDLSPDTGIVARSRRMTVLRFNENNQRKFALMGLLQELMVVGNIPVASLARVPLGSGDDASR